MSVTKEQALAARYQDEFHCGECSRTIGPRGGITEKIVRCRVSGACKVWKTRPAEFRLPVKHGLYESGAIEHTNSDNFHRASECPLLDSHS